MPTYLYHATAKENVLSIKASGLEPRSVGGSPVKYLCMSGTESGAITLGNKASDVKLRVKCSELNISEWSESGAGKKEWRSDKGISSDKLECRRNLGSEEQKKWVAIKVYVVA
jgi:RNA:NAD 2'-phosphotransferase (TPT1/KptA family)